MGNCVSQLDEQVKKPPPPKRSASSTIKRAESQRNKAEGVVDSEGVHVQVQAQAGEATGAANEAVQAAKNEYGEVTAAAQDAAAQGVQLADAGADAGQEALNQTCEIEAAPEVPHGTSRTGDAGKLSHSLSNNLQGDKQTEKQASISRSQSGRVGAAPATGSKPNRSPSSHYSLEDARATAEAQHLDAVKAKAAENAAKAKEIAEAKAAESRAAVQREKAEKAAKLEADRIKAAELKAAGEKAAREARAAEEARLEAKAKAAKAKAEAKERETKAAAERRAAEYRAAKEKAAAIAEAERQEQAEAYRAARARERALGPEKMEVKSRHLESAMAVANKAAESGTVDNKGLLQSASGAWVPAGAAGRNKPSFHRAASQRTPATASAGGAGKLSKAATARRAVSPQAEARAGQFGGAAPEPGSIPAGAGAREALEEAAGNGAEAVEAHAAQGQPAASYAAVVASSSGVGDKAEEAAGEAVEGAGQAAEGALGRALEGVQEHVEAAPQAAAGLAAAQDVMGGQY